MIGGEDLVFRLPKPEVLLMLSGDGCSRATDGKDATFI